MARITMQDVHPLSDFKRRTSEFLLRLRTEKRPLLLTLNGRAEVVVLDADSYQELMDRIEHLELLTRATAAKTLAAGANS
jgi:prevent-host-death family protein